MMHYRQMLTHSEIAKKAGTHEAAADRFGVSIHTFRSWIMRDSIPADQWTAFATAGFATLEQLAAAAEHKRLASGDKRRADAA